MYSIALCLDAPMQSWGTRSRGSIRDTAREPTKSGVVGLIAAALGVPRDESDCLAELSTLRMGVRVDREGILERDFHVTQNVPTTAGGGHRTALSHRYYLADALFLVVLTDADEDRLDQIQRALRAPVWPLFLGRRAFPPARPLLTNGYHDGALTGQGLTRQPLEMVLATHPWLEDRPEVRAAERRRPDRQPLRTVIDCDLTDPDAELRMDVPKSFTPDDRRYAARTVRSGTVHLTDDLITAKDLSCTSAS
ncbi:type I-E CRISPR-associated protein Cas5/CasD [Micromonospora craniellae]|uniref:Type I-E CRISPR-associated protein Cas5/CasD n=1 Tax=Micromonospora craniellae TaxID=2294034 RepID=A0A372FRX7_9ACTN|nr:type I-E CRISPR-associated protein Cas5/CasD [Micromonospora craniellae]QOC92369.1 type I-E CRISPR-associated protein Cas5/CasD [Micromonospora craniellae]RFS43374.1 type I-E CRISPR-associated protein Cas5/CasD [Micromonospora craniellae]